MPLQELALHHELLYFQHQRPHIETHQQCSPLDPILVKHLGQLPPTKLRRCLLHFRVEIQRLRHLIFQVGVEFSLVIFLHFVRLFEDAQQDVKRFYGHVVLLSDEGFEGVDGPDY